ncbi:hypothetical protein H5407_05745 [Mitsuaria sp. WAJ17]|uniref:hypothetical protein n=1 Tax=Mitsuaria sp. WAJ17 TaxID=2761452 RepID=UPI001601BF89|nr:hypothetical protein [Mitsuaria sp. WAJ17]MBB2484726.1 hypothetical protein [Mitsuaria sp. WAJ17]
MAMRTPSIDLQKVLSGAARLEVKLLNAGVEALQVYINQASRFSSLAAETLQAVQEDKATLADTARKLSDFGRQSAHAYADLAQRLSASYYDEFDRLANSGQKTPSALPAARARTRRASAKA